MSHDASFGDRQLSGERIGRVLDRVAAVHRYPTAIVYDNGPELCSQVLDQWAHDRGVALQFIDPGKPIERVRRELQRTAAR
jgi:putative transposase